MITDQWSAVDEYLTGLLAPAEATLERVLRTSAEAGLPSIHVSAAQGRLLMILAQALGARSILEIGTLGAYSTIWLARGLAEDGRVITLESEPKHAEVARANIVAAGLDRIIDLRLGPALETLPRIAAEDPGPFDLIFIDADKTGYPAYLPWALKLSRPGSLILADNVVRRGAVIEPVSDDERVVAVRRFLEMVAAEPRLMATVIQTVGSKGYDGLAVAVVTG